MHIDFMPSKLRPSVMAAILNTCVYALGLAGIVLLAAALPMAADLPTYADVLLIIWGVGAIITLVILPFVRARIEDEPLHEAITDDGWGMVCDAYLWVFRIFSIFR